MITQLAKKFSSLKQIDVQTGASEVYGKAVITLKDETKIYVGFYPGTVMVDIWEDGINLWSTKVRRRRDKGK